VTVTVQDVLTASGAGASDTTLATSVLSDASLHVGNYIASSLLNELRPVPLTLRDSAVLMCATDLFAARKAPFGQQVAPDLNGQMVVTRLGSDPLARVRPMLRSYCHEITFAFPAGDDG